MDRLADQDLYWKAIISVHVRCMQCYLFVSPIKSASLKECDGSDWYKLIKKRSERIFCLISLVLLQQVASVQAQTGSSFWQKLNPDSLVNRPLRFVPLPVLQTGPEIGVKGGLTLDYFYNAGTGRADKPRFQSRYWRQLDSVARQTRDSYAYVHGLYSTRRQLAIEGVWQTYGAGERYVLRGRGGFIDFAEDFWAVGNRTVAE